jgi:hypothetical protein
MKALLARIRARIIEVKMLHVSLGSNLWHPMDVWFVLSGKVPKC